jgi:hypothetical protein
VTYLKMAGAGGRVLASFVSPVVSQLHPRPAKAAARPDRAAVMSDALWSCALLAGIGMGAVVLTPPITGSLLTLVYGSEYAALVGASVVLLGEGA